MRLASVLIVTLVYAFCLAYLILIALLSFPVNMKRWEDAPPARSLERNEFLDRHLLDNSVEHPHKNKENRQAQTYAMLSVVQCLDSLSSSKNRPIHIAFVGDSLLRQHFLNFLELIPDYDRKLSRKSTATARYNFHEDRNVTSRLLNNLLVSFRWRAVIDDEFLFDFKRWATLDDTQVPDFIFAGATVHHMQQNVSHTNRTFEDIVEHDLLPALRTCLIAHPHQKIIWHIQGPSRDLLGPIIDSKNLEIHVNKIRQYNNIARRVLGESGVLMWDSFNAAIEEYMRSCFLSSYLRQDRNKYLNCQDFIHPGFGMLSIATHELVANYICNDDDIY